MGSYVEILNAYFGDVFDVKEYFEFEFVFEIFVLYIYRIVIIINFDVPGQED